MRHDSAVYLPRFEMLCRDVLAPAAWPDAEPISVSEWACPDRFAWTEAARTRDAGGFEPVSLPHRWGPAWSTRWFHLSGAVPDRLVDSARAEGRRLRIRFDPGTEATVWDAAGNPCRGLDENRDAFELRDSGEIDVLVEAACNHPFGDQVFNWDSRERGERWRSETPGLVTRAEVAVFDEGVWRLVTRLNFARQLLAELDPASTRAQDLYACLARAADVIDDSDPCSAAESALAWVDRGLSCEPGGSSPRLICVAHAHIDTAWLWPIAETRRKTVRSWTNTLELMEREPSLRMICSQPQQYAWLERDAPGVFERLRERVGCGQWQPIGSMWVEPDALVPSGESLIRQVLVGAAYFEDRFPNAAKQRIVFLPDTFGFPACLPTIMHACGLDTFITNKIHWNQTNTFPHTSFRWRGLDGAEVLAHNTPGGDYNATLTPKELRKAQANIAGRDAALLPGGATALQPFGFGDGGGGPTDEMLERARAARACEGLPRAELGSVHDFVEALAREDELAGGLPVWSGPIDLELHRGVLTTHRWLKQANADAERGLRAAELVVAGPVGALPERGSLDALADAWERTLLNQFHDILPGSSISAVYDDARADHARIRETVDSIVPPSNEHAAFYNGTSEDRVAVIEQEGSLTTVRVAGFGIHTPSPTDMPPVRIESGVVSNGLVSFKLDASGRLGMLRCAGGRDLVGGTPLNTLRLYRDRPMNWDAWDIDLDYERQLVWTNDAPARVEVVTDDPCRAELRVELMIAGSPAEQVFRLDAGSPMVEVTTRIDWRESHRLLRAESAPAVHADRVTVGTQFGHTSRPVHRNTSWDRMAFEFACHGWMDLSEPGAGLAVLADAMFGRSAHGSTMGLSMLRATTHPDPDADRGSNVLRYAYLPHLGDWRSADVDAWSARFAELIRAVSADPTAPVSLTTEGAGRVEIACYKPGRRDPRARILRLVETRGARTMARITLAGDVARVRTVNAIEADLVAEHQRVWEGPSCELELAPFQIVTLLVEPTG